MRWCWVNFQCQGVLLIWIIVGKGPTALAVGAGGGYLDIFSLVYHFSFLSPSLWETDRPDMTLDVYRGRKTTMQQQLWKTARQRLKYCLKGPLSPKQPTNQPTPCPKNWDNLHIVNGSTVEFLPRKYDYIAKFSSGKISYTWYCRTVCRL